MSTQRPLVQVSLSKTHRPTDVVCCPKQVRFAWAESVSFSKEFVTVRPGVCVIKENSFDGVLNSVERRASGRHRSSE